MHMEVFQDGNLLLRHRVQIDGLTAGSYKSMWAQHIIDEMDTISMEELNLLLNGLSDSLSE